MRRIVAVLAAATVAASCTGGAPRAARTPTPHPFASYPHVTWYTLAATKRIPILAGGPVVWLSATPAPTPKPTLPPGIKPCTAAGLLVSLGMQGATGGQMAGVIKLTNQQQEPCTPRSYPVVQLLDRTGAVIPAPDSRGRREQPKPLTWPLLVVQPGGSSWINMFSSNWCGPHVAAWRLLLQGSGALIIRQGWRMGLCEARPSPSFLSVGPVEPPPTQPKWPLVPMIFGEPFHASPGASLSYVVLLMNVPENGAPSVVPTKAGSFRFHLPCPSYVEHLTQGGVLIATERHVLNCAQVGPIPGNVAISFVMQMQVPPGAVGKAKVTWMLDPPFGFSRSVPVIIDT